MTTVLGPATGSQAAVPPTTGEDHASRVDPYAGFRPEVEGLRAVAVLLVVVYHVFLGRVSGGVDVFLLISAFFLTLSFTRKLQSGRPLGLGRYWLHVFKRLLPLAVLIILGTLLLVELFYPDYDIGQWRSEALSSVLYVQNWALAFNAVDYYAVDHSTASPFQHFWSLSVQGQVFLLWPLVFAAAALITRRTRLRLVPVLAVAFGTVFVVSLAWSVHSTATQQQFAYFDTRTRLWEFALGSLLALAVPFVRLSRPVRVVLGWLGLLSMISVGVLVDVQGAFPGWIALWPLASAAAIIVAGQSGSPFGLDRVLSSRPLTALGSSAYALYLIHWPLLITYLVLRDRPTAGPRSGVVLVVVCVVAAVALTRWVEKPLKAWAWPERTRARLALVVVVCVGLVAVPVVAVQQADARRAAEIEASADRNNPGAAALLPGFTYRGDPGAPTVPVLADGTEHWTSAGPPCPDSLGIDPARRPYCFESAAQDAPVATVLLLGSSHVQHWVPAVRRMAEERGWRVIAYVAPGCYYSTHEEQLHHERCAPWLDGVESVLETVRPDLVIGSGTLTSTTGESLPAGMADRIRSLDARGIPFLGLRDTPRFEMRPARCAMEHGMEAPECTAEHPVLRTANPMAGLADELPRASTADLGDLICPERTCRPAIGNVWVYWDDDHLSAEYAGTLAPAFAQRVDAALATDGIELPTRP
ncbi:acyltransferase family protein [Kocuria sp. U4B]